MRSGVVVAAMRLVWQRIIKGMGEVVVVPCEKNDKLQISIFGGVNLKFWREPARHVPLKCIIAKLTISNIVTSHSPQAAKYRISSPI